MNTWIVCARPKRARIFECHSLDEGLRFVAEVPRPTAPEAEGPFDQDVRSQGFPLEELAIATVDERDQLDELPPTGLRADPHGRSSEILDAAFSDGLDDPELVARLTKELEDAFHADAFDHLILCADHALLVPLRSSLPPDLRGRVIGAVEQDLFQVNESDLVNYITSFIIDAHRAA